MSAADPGSKHVPTEHLSGDTRRRPGSEAWLGRALVVVAALMWSTSAFFAKAPIFNAWPLEHRGALLTFWRAAFACTVLLVLVRRIQWSPKLIPTTLFFAAMNWTYINAMVYAEASLAIWLQYTAPAWVFVGGLLLFGERGNWRDWILLAFAAVGVAVILAAEIRGAAPAGVRYGLGSGILFACVILSIRWCREIDSAWVILLNHAVTAAVFLPLVWNVDITPSGQQWLYLFGFGALQLGIPYVLFASAVKRIASHEASGLALLEPVLVPVWVWLAWRDHAEYQFPSWTTMVGGGLILTGLVTRYWGTRKRGTGEPKAVE